METPICFIPHCSSLTTPESMLSPEKPLWHRRSALNLMTFHFRTSPGILGQVAAPMIVTMHRASLCMQKIGIEMTTERSQSSVALESLFLQMRSKVHVSFGQNLAQTHRIFFCLHCVPYPIAHSTKYL